MYFIDTTQTTMQNASWGTTEDPQPGHVSDFRVHVPPLPTQRKIAAILSAYDDLIEVNTRRIALLEEMARGLYREWFVRFRFPGHEGVRMVESAVGVVPEGWEVKALGDIARGVRRGVQPGQIDPETPYFGLASASESPSRWPSGEPGQVQSTKLAFKRAKSSSARSDPTSQICRPADDGVCSTDTIVIVPRGPNISPLSSAASRAKSSSFMRRPPLKARRCRERHGKCWSSTQSLSRPSPC